MNRLLSSLPVILFALCIFSCKKPKDDANDTASGSTLVSKVMVWDAAQPQKAIQIIDFKYDSLNRVTEIVYSSGDSVNGAINSYIVRTNKCFYNGNGTNPYKTIGFKLPLGYPSSDVYHYYTNSGVLAADSTGTWRTYTGYYKRELAWSADKIIATHNNTYSGSLRQTKDTMFIDGNNITGYNTTLTGNIEEYKFKYDNKINPLANLNIALFTVVDGTDGIEGFVAPGYCKNNITESFKKSTKILVNGTSTSTTTTAFMYTYNNKGLPIERLVSADKSTITKYYYREN
ncbi:MULTISPECIES: hypothetical protein [Niastella]|uniref:DUF4595 domain-containing protein n=1 Tax=Niastella soli TaxID=2821487 RepID=A0ABS3YVY0_9BACT|nr:hypothetical protein [Niastella soli]MBO9202070.1 hypothetical protein [Niastella soli]